MKAFSKEDIKHIFAKSQITPAMMRQLINSLWRDYQYLYAEKSISEQSAGKADPASAEFNQLYELVRNSFLKTELDGDSCYASAIGHNNSLKADFSQVYGFFNQTNAFFETIFGRFATIDLEQNPAEWINTDRLFVIGNGASNSTRSNALEIFKSGLVKWYNAQVFGEYSHQNDGESPVTPPDGTLQYTIANGFEYAQNGIWYTLHGKSAYELAVQNGFVGTLSQWLVSLQGDPGENGKSAYELAVENGFSGTESEWLESLKGDPGPDTFIELTDTPAVYPSINRGQMLRQNGASSLGFATRIGENSTGVWLSSGSMRSVGGELYDAGYATFVEDEWYRIRVVISGATQGEATLYIDGVDIEVFNGNDTFYVYWQAFSSGSLSVSVTGNATFDGTIESIQVLPVYFTTGTLKIVDGAYNPLAELQAYKDESNNTVLILENEAVFNVTLKKWAIGDTKVYDGGKFTVITFREGENAIYGWSESGFGGNFSKINCQGLYIFQEYIIDNSGFYIPQATQSSNAPNNRIYRDESTAKLMYKDPSGNVYDLTQSGGGVPGTETLSGTSVTVSWNGKTAASLTLTGATTVSFGTPANYVKRLFVTGDYSLTLPASAEVLSGEYNGSTTNIIDLIPSPSGTVYVTIN